MVVVPLGSWSGTFAGPGLHRRAAPAPARNMRDLLEANDLILIEAAVIEQLRRAARVRLHPTLENATLIYDDTGREELSALYRSYISIAAGAGLPFIMCTPTWRANRERLRDSQVNLNVNRHAVRFMQDLRDAQGPRAGTIKIGGLVGPMNDCYKPEEGLSAAGSEELHSWQVDQLAQEGVDFLVAETLPSVEEAIGMAKAMERTAAQYVISFVIDRKGCVLDGTRLSEAVASVDGRTARRPLGYMVNCSYPAFLCAEKQPSELFDRLIGYQANASALQQSELDGAAELRYEDVGVWGEEMLKLNRKYGVKILGGCCGTGAEHLEYLARGASR